MPLKPEELTRMLHGAMTIQQIEHAHEIGIFPRFSGRIHIGNVELLAGVLFGLAPALQSTSQVVRLSLGARSAGTTGLGGARRIFQALMVSEVALAMILVVGASLMLQSFRRLNEVDPGFQAEGLLTFMTWAQIMGIFWLIQLLFFTTFLTNARNGFASGVIGSLGYWLAQQEVARGGQPWYYYFMLSGLYEFLPLLLSTVGVAVVAYHLSETTSWDPVPARERMSSVDDDEPALMERLRTNRL